MNMGHPLPGPADNAPSAASDPIRASIAYMNSKSQQHMHPMYRLGFGARPDACARVVMCCPSLRPNVPLNETWIEVPKRRAFMMTCTSAAMPHPLTHT